MQTASSRSMSVASMSMDGAYARQQLLDLLGALHVGVLRQHTSTRGRADLGGAPA
ncbi:MAG: hypothetical protein R2854_04065 [Caldilineaceae bacterium]